ncbi:glycerophosphodiester phosphodiesterase [Stella sp.]|uniref:glycerophosphodiester phosphodiesterase n=1 Tax=Stella sp. TaxID=2912054 RepID=UPI0035AFB5C9
MTGAVRVVAHRGASETERENSPRAAAAAIAAGAWAVEMDARFSADGVVHVAHDPDLARIAGLGAEVAAMTAAEIAGHRAPDGDPWVPTLRDLLAVVAGRVPAVIDIKIRGPEMLRAIADAAPPGMEPDLVLGVRAIEDVAAARAILPRARVLGLLPGTGDPAALATAGGFAIRFWEPDATRERVAVAHATGLEAWVTAGRSGGRGEEAVGACTPDRLRRLAALGIDGILVNDPATAVAVLTAG